MFYFNRKKKIAKNIHDLPEVPDDLIKLYTSVYAYLQEDINPLKKLEAIYFFTDKYGKFLYPYFPCKKKCSYCCCIPVTVFSIEAEYISKKTKRDTSFYKIDNKYSPCPFLKDHKCSIYKIRPFKCRTCFVLDGPDTCNTTKGNKIYGQIYNIQMFNELEVEIIKISTSALDIREIFK